MYIYIYMYVCMYVCMYVVYDGVCPHHMYVVCVRLTSWEPAVLVY